MLDEDHGKLPTLICLPKLHKGPFILHLIAIPSLCKTIALSMPSTLSLPH